MAKLDNDGRISLLKTMLKIRKFEEKVSENFAAGQIPGFIHLSIGQEAVSAGACYNLRKKDYISTTHRGHGQCIAKGVEINPLMAEIFGKATGYCKGKGGSMHIASLDYGMLGANGIVAGGIPMAVGAAYSAKYRKTDQVVASFFGDGATGEGAFYESMNIASIMKLPIVFVCENNRWAEFSPQQIHMDIHDVAQKAKAFGNVASETIDGNDVETVVEAMDRAVARARTGAGPTLLECITTRFHGHYEGDPQKYRPKEDLEAARSKDPIARYKALLIKDGVIDEAGAGNVESEVEKIIEDALQFAKESPEPDSSEMLKDVYFN